jgi:hypothetical protein
MVSNIAAIRGEVELKEDLEATLKAAPHLVSVSMTRQRTA